MLNRVLAGTLLFAALCGAALATTRPIGPELAPVADGLTIGDWVQSCTVDTTVDCGKDIYGTDTSGDDGKLRFLCEVSHLSYNDPIVFPGRAGATHLHHFFGNTLTDHNSTYATLRATGGGSCQGGPLNRTGYWFPAMIKTDTFKVVVPDFIELYYNVSRAQLHDDGSGGFTSPVCPGGTLDTGAVAACPMFAVGPIERGMKAIFGAYASTGAFPSTYVRTSVASGRNFHWSCTGGGNKDVLWDGDTPSNGVQGCAAGTTVQVRMEAPQCWNGAYDHTDHYSHLAFQTQDGSGNPVCPATHPYRIPSITLIIGWSHNGEADYKTWKLSSDIFNGANFRAGETFHTDALWAWNDTIQNDFHKEINGMHPTPGVTPYTSNASGAAAVGAGHVRDSVNGGLGNGTNLIANSVDGSATPSASRYIDIPANSAKKGGRGKGGMR